MENISPTPHEKSLSPELSLESFEEQNSPYAMPQASLQSSLNVKKHFSAAETDDLLRLFVLKMKPVPPGMRSINHWNEIAQEISQKYHVPRTGAQCKSRFSYVMEQCRAALDFNATHTEQKPVPFMDWIRMILDTPIPQNVQVPSTSTLQQMVTPVFTSQSLSTRNNWQQAVTDTILLLSDLVNQLQAPPGLDPQQWQLRQLVIQQTSQLVSQLNRSSSIMPVQPFPTKQAMNVSAQSNVMMANVPPSPDQLGMTQRQQYAIPQVELPSSVAPSQTVTMPVTPTKRVESEIATPSKQEQEGMESDPSQEQHHTTAKVPSTPLTRSKRKQLGYVSP